MSAGAMTPLRSIGEMRPPIEEQSSERRVYLLPLLEPLPGTRAASETPPLHLLPSGRVEPPRACFTLPNAETWIASSHVFPGAYPRSSTHATAPPSVSPTLQDSISPPPSRFDANAGAWEKEKRRHDFQKWEDMCHRYQDLHPLVPPHSRLEADRRAREIMRENAGKEPRVWGVVERLRPAATLGRASKGTGLTLVFAHANGFHKEIYEPCIEEMLRAFWRAGDTSVYVEEIWSLDTYTSGEAGALNRKNFGQQGVPWIDPPRDILQFLTYYLPETNSDHARSVLERTDERQGAKKRRLVGIGHSFMGAAMNFLAVDQPELFEALFIIDPVVGQDGKLLENIAPIDVPLARGAIARKDVFRTGQEAREYFLERPFFKTWDPRVLRLHLAHGLRPIDAGDPHGAQTLCCSKWSEALAFGSSWQARFALANASQLDSPYRGKVHVVTMSETAVYGGTELAPLVRRQLLGGIGGGAASGRGSEEEMEGDHLVAQEQPERLGKRLAEKLTAWFREGPATPAQAKL